MKVLNKFMLTLVIIMASVMFGVFIIGILRANGWVMMSGMIASAILFLIVKHWDDVAQ
jgi:hypothetical protein